MDFPRLSALRAECSEEIARRLINRAEQALEAEVGSSDEYSHLMRSAEGAVLAGNTALARRLADRAESLATTQLAALGAWAADPGAKVGSVPQSLTDSRTRLESRIRGDLAGIREAQMALATPEGRRSLARAARERRHSEYQEKLVSLTEQAVSDLLAEGQLEAARDLAAELFESELADPLRAEQVRQADTQGLERLRRLVRAHRALGEPLHHGALPRIGRLEQAAIERLLAPRTPGGGPSLEAVVRARWTLSPLEEADRWRSTARALAYYPEVFDPDWSAVTKGDAFSTWIPVNLEVFMALGPSFVEDPGFLEPIVLVRPHPRRDGVFSVWAGVRLGASVEGREHLPAMITPAGETRAQTARGQRAKALGLLEVIGVRRPMRERAAVLEWDGQLVSAADPRGDLPPRPAHALYGLDLCTHDDSSWRLNPTEDALTLACRDCRRLAIAVVPRHRLSAGAKSAINAQTASATLTPYLRREAFYRELVGDRRPVTGIEDLDEAPLSTTPSDYAVRPAPAGRGRTMAGALSRLR